jgi:small-conductance mechanosensitive channel
MENFLKTWRDPLLLPLFKLGGTNITTGLLLGILVAFFALLVLSSWLRRWLSKHILAKSHLDLSTREAVASLTRYIVLTIGVMIIIDAAGIRLSSFTVLAGALGVGVGFGLQNIFSNFISGLIVMF